MIETSEKKREKLPKYTDNFYPENNYSNGEKIIYCEQYPCVQAQITNIKKKFTL